MTQANHPEQVPEKGVGVKPGTDVEVNPAKPGNNTEVDLDKGKTQTYPGTTPPERH